MKNVLIGITSSLRYENEGVFSGLGETYISEGYINSIIKSNATPIVLPVNDEIDIIKKYAEMIDGLLVTGGYDVTPLYYGQEPHKLLGATLQKRDEFEIRLIKEVFKLGKPILGICRGLQLINVVFGGTLYQDISLHKNEVIQHTQKTRFNLPSHKINLNGILEKIYEKNEIFVNSYHHQAIDKLAPDFEIIATANDGIIEGIKYGNVLAVQWHPEVLDNSKPIFDLFVKSCK
ncbi:gamma-glutamyl-gamma-aminobutyrate hydrolase family protein [Streptobacillus felis]|uniref:Gamma-glutamyl-gamma-aminobutyrate hydrolase family protein n=1 Tax=Streptobacillus felis TaxID=1384509 RepID=A0A7Z0PHB2_9FUSO|nr:gamma-glutamyl-gamma-aminobutyrate hydrolase family protein [Streptobacillus felis]NYV28245.1 gamma-glutamyl-gamma-aminobutyrate hydrolase family protein [Streptobacillus felis]